MPTSRRLTAAAIATLLATGACASPTTLPIADSQPQFSSQNAGKETVVAPLSGATTSSDSTSPGTGRGPGVGSGH